VTGRLSTRSPRRLPYGVGLTAEKPPERNDHGEIGGQAERCYGDQSRHRFVRRPAGARDRQRYYDSSREESEACPRVIAGKYHQTHHRRQNTQWQKPAADFVAEQLPRERAVSEWIQ
jgi:hypothetical protein